MKGWPGLCHLKWTNLKKYSRFSGRGPLLCDTVWYLVPISIHSISFSKKAISENSFLWDQPPPSLIDQFSHENWSIKTEMLVFLGVFYWIFNVLPWPDPKPASPSLPTPKPAKPVSRCQSMGSLVRRTTVCLRAIPWFPWSWTKILISKLETSQGAHL